jgi:hypothetical protein
MKKDPSSTGYFEGCNKIFFFGGLLIFCALTSFFFKVSQHQGERGLFVLSLTYALIFNGTGIYLWKYRNKKGLGGMSCFLSLLLVPIVAYALPSVVNYQPIENLFPNSDSLFWLGDRRWFLIKMSTIVATLITLYFVRFPLLTVILYPFLWLMSENISPLFTIYQNDPMAMLNLESAVRIVISCSFIASAYLLDRKNRPDFAFWGYLCGVILFWGDITLSIYITEWANLIYLTANLALLGLWALLKRRIFVVCGALGVLNYVIQLYLRHDFTLAFPVLLSFAGLLVIGWGIFLKYRRK